MGQQTGKEVRSKHGSTSASSRSTGASAATGGSRPAVRPTAVNDAVLQSTRHADPTAPAGGASTKYPIVLRYVDQDVSKLIEQKKKVFVAVEANGWKQLPMTPSADSFYALLELPAGNHNYRFFIDGAEVVDRTQPLAPSAASATPPVGSTSGGPGIPVTTPLPKPVPTKDGKPANTIYLNDVLLSTKEDDDIMDNGEGWGQETIMFEESRKYPPIVPIHLRYTPLNTPPTLVRCSRDGRMAVMDSDLGKGARMPPEHLPMPLSVTINHVYFQRREDHAVMGVTTRYCNKFATVIYYTHLPSKPADLEK